VRKCRHFRRNAVHKHKIHHLHVLQRPTAWLVLVITIVYWFEIWHFSCSHCRYKESMFNENEYSVVASSITILPLLLPLQCSDDQTQIICVQVLDPVTKQWISSQQHSIYTPCVSPSLQNRIYTHFNNIIYTYYN